MKSIIAILMVLVMLLSFAACGAKEDPSQDESKPSEATTTTEASAETTEGDEFEIPTTTGSAGNSTTSGTNGTGSKNTTTTKKKLAGTTAKVSEVNVGDLTNVTLPTYNVKGTKVKFLTTDTESESSKTLAADFKKAYGAELQWVSSAWNDLANNLGKMVLANNAPDVTILRSGMDFPLVAAKGLIQPYGDKVNLNTKLWSGAKWLIEENQFKGQNYILIGGVGTADNIWFNKNMMRNAGIEVLPDKLYEQGKWDWDALVKIGKQLTDTKSDKPTYGLGSDYQLLANDIMAARGSSFLKFDANGKQSLALLAPEVTEALNFYSDLYFKEKIMSPSGQEMALFLANRLGMLVQGSWLTQTNTRIGTMYKSGTIGLVPMPKWPGLEESGNLTTSSFAIPKGAKNVEGGLAFASYMRYTSVDEKTVKAKQKEIIDKGLMSEREYGYLKQASSKGFLRRSLVGDTGNWYWKPFNDLQAGDSWTTVVPKYQSQFQKCVDEYNAMLK